MQTKRLLGFAVLLALVACGGDDENSDVQSGTASAGGESTESGDGDGNGDGDSGGSDGATEGGDVVNPQPPGQAMVSVDGKEFTLTEPGALDCTLADDSITFSFRIGDNEVTLGGGANRADDQWFGSINVTVAYPDGEEGPVAYFPDLAANSDKLVIDGDSLSYSGPMRKQPRNDGSNPPPIDVGDGLISITCP